MAPRGSKPVPSATTEDSDDTLSTNRISLTLPDADGTELQAALKMLQDKLMPLLVDLSPQDRRELPKMGDKTLAFVGKALDYAQANPQLCPPYLDVPEFQKDMASVQMLQSLLRPLAQAADIVDDSLMLAGSEAYAAALVFYQSGKSAARSKVLGAATIADDLGARFPGRSTGTQAAKA